MQSSEVLIGLWLRGLDQGECARLISDWRASLTATGGGANDNDPTGAAEGKARAVVLLDATCATCRKVCPLNPLISLRAPPRPAARQASRLGRRR